MEKEELLKKDWQLLTAYAEIKTISYLRTVLDNQAVIIAELTKIPLKSVAKQMKKFEDENYSTVMQQVKENIPDYPDYKPRDLKYSKSTKPTKK